MQDEDRQITLLANELRAMSVEAATLRASIGNLERGIAILGREDSRVLPKRAGPSSLPPELMGELTRELNGLRKARRERTAAVKEKAELEHMLHTVDAATKAAAAVTDEALTATDQKGDNARHYRSTRNQLCDLEAKRREIAKFAEEEATLKAEHTRGLQRLVQLSRELDALGDMDWEVYRLNAEIRIRENQLQSVREEATSIRRILYRKTLFLNHITSSDVTPDVHLMTGIKAVEQKKLLQHHEHVVRGRSALHAGAVSVKLLVDRLHFLGCAIADALKQVSDDVDEEALCGVCDATEVDDVRRELQAVLESESRERSDIDYLDAAVRTLETRTDILTHAIDVRRREMTSTARQTERCCCEIDAEGARHVKAAQAMISRRLASVANLRESVALHAPPVDT